MGSGAVLSLLLTLAAAAAPEALVDLEDPSGDADGPGTYTAPTDSELGSANFDLRRFVVRVEPPSLVFEVTLGEPIRPPASLLRTNATPAELKNGIFLQNIDLYVDTDPAHPAGGVAEGIPGRRVGFTEGRTWKRAVVLTPLPQAVAQVVEGALGKQAWRVAVPTVTARGRTVVARVPLSFFGAKPSRAWGWSVQVSGAAWERNFQLQELAFGSSGPNAQTMPVSTISERWAFGGAPLGRSHPQVLDVLVPAGVSQHAMLGSYNNDTKTQARVPFVYLEAPAAEVALTPPPPPTLPPADAGEDTWVVAALDGDAVSITGPTAGLRAMMFGQVLDAAGAVLARVVVTRVLPNGVLASLVEAQAQVAPGARVRFTVKREP
jgi:carbohydrate-binding DOMON domain-containing protein